MIITKADSTADIPRVEGRGLMILEFSRSEGVEHFKIAEGKGG